MAAYWDVYNVRSFPLVFPGFNIPGGSSKTIYLVAREKRELIAAGMRLVRNPLVESAPDTRGNIVQRGLTNLEMQELAPAAGWNTDNRESLLTYTYTSMVDSILWTVAHNLGFRPNVGVYDTGGNVVDCEVVHLSENVLQAMFTAPTRGTLRAN